MSVNLIKPFFRSQLISLGYDNEWPDAYKFSDIPSTRRDKAFHILIGAAFSASQNQTDQTILIPVGLTVFFKAGRIEEDARIAAMAAAEQIIKKICDPKVRTSEASEGIKDVRISSFEAVPLSDDQDNVTQLNMAFELLYILDFEDQ
jgi:hypothetical protein